MYKKDLIICCVNMNRVNKLTPTWWVVEGGLLAGLRLPVRSRSRVPPLL